MTIFTATSALSGNRTSMELPITRDQYHAWTVSGELIQDYFPQLDEDQREFLLTGITPQEWARWISE